MEKLIDFTKKELNSIEIGMSHTEVHSAWKDETNDGFLICYELMLSLSGGKHYIVKPCEINLPNRYPALGLSISPSQYIKLETVLTGIDLPSMINGVNQTDFLGEDVINQYLMILENKLTIKIRHVYPPMTMGVKIET